MFAQALCGAIRGIDAHVVPVDVEVITAMPAFITIGLPQGAVSLRRERVIAVLQNSGYLVAPKRITVSLAPADSRNASAFDLAIAIGVAAATGQLDGAAPLHRHLLAGELALDGDLRPIPGALSLAAAAKHAGMTGIILPRENVPEASLVAGLEVRGAETLREVIGYLEGRLPLPPAIPDPRLLSATADDGDFAEVKGHEHAKRALEVAAAGGHGALMVGPPGGGKTMLAGRLGGILPPLTHGECVEILKIRSVAGLTAGGIASCGRPFRNPHPTLPDVGMVGGGTSPRPGEISLAHHGVLFLDELAEFRPGVLQSLRQPLRDGVVTLVRGRQSLAYPSRVILVAAMNPCPCGWRGDAQRRCTCGPEAVRKYLARVAGLMDRLDVQVEVPAVRYRDLGDERRGESTATIRERVSRARAVQQERLKGSGAATNAEIADDDVENWCRLNEAGDALLRSVVTRLGLSARARPGIMRIARTIADLDACGDISVAHLAEAVQYRALVRAISPPAG